MLLAEAGITASCPFPDAFRAGMPHGAARREEARDEERKRRTMLAHRKLEAWGGVAALRRRCAGS